MDTIAIKDQHSSPNKGLHQRLIEDNFNKQASPEHFFHNVQVCRRVG